MSAAGLPSTTPPPCAPRDFELALLPAHRMRWLAKSDAVAVSADGASCSHECNSWDTACGDTWFSQGIVTIELLTDEVDRPSLYAGIVSRDHVFEEDTALRELSARALHARRRPRLHPHLGEGLGPHADGER